MGQVVLGLFLLGELSYIIICSDLSHSMGRVCLGPSFYLGELSLVRVVLIPLKPSWLLHKKSVPVVFLTSNAVLTDI